jgi:triacylglycerol lipase
VFDVVRGKDVDTQGVIAVDAKRILVAFLGSELKVGDWWANFQAVKDPGPFRKTKVHEGFQDAFLPAALDIGIRIGQQRTDQDIWVTGHSLGGALAARR